MSRSVWWMGFLVVTVIPSFGQGDFRPGYIITRSKDSINLNVDYRGKRASSENCVTKTPGGKGRKTYQPDELLFYGFIGGKRFASHLVPTKNGFGWVFLEQIVGGELSLLRLKDDFFVMKDTLMRLPPPKGQVIYADAAGMRLKKDLTYVGLLNFLMADCNLTAERTPYEEENFLHLVQSYNRCKGSEGTVFKARIPSFEISYLAYAGIENSKLVMTSLFDEKFKPTSSPVFGVGVNMVFPKIFDRMSLGIDIFYTPKTYQALFELPNGSGTYYFDYTIKTSFLKAILGLKYNFLKDERTPYLRFGVTTYVGLNSTSNVIVENENGGLVTTNVFTPVPKFDNMLGIWGGVGFSGRIAQFRPYAEVRYEAIRGGIWLDTNFYNSTLSNLSVLVGLRF